MAITTYAELQTSVNNWTERDEAAARLQEFISLAEARLNRLIGAVETDTTLTGVVDNRVIDISAVSIERPIALWVVVSGDEEKVQLQADGTFPYDDTSGQPEMWAIDGTDINFNRPCDQAYSFRLRYRERFALSDAATTNWLLTKHPDVYFAAAMMWGAGYREDTEMGMVWKGLLDEAIPEIRHSIAQSKRGTLRVDPALIKSAGGFNYETGD